MSRYARQMQLPEIGEAGQSRLGKAHVAVVGAGGLGCPVLQYLVGAGIEKISIFDPDEVEESNLHRQPLYGMPDIGKPKALAARDALRALNPQVEVSANVESIGPTRAPEIAANADLVIDAADSFAASYILSDACLAEDTPLVSASVLGQTGYVGGFCGGAPSLRAVFPELPATGATCATAGVLGPVVGVIGALQAQIAIKVLLGAQPALGQMITADLSGMHFGGFSFLGNPEPETAIPFIAEPMLQCSDLIIELRSHHEAPKKIRPEAERISEAELRNQFPFSRQRVVLCCQSGLRAWRAAKGLQAQGETNLALLAARASK
ncbi:ThiF family adenylyltransferase [Ruegeria conchae]|uniref:ThiF family adenylyltransferase n=1 Tax=Ruegeria conchae TaxID=981384 RepID=UPI0021A3150F|nr:ThiF family adenylyltransferase [Ruegeria conchae]UWR03797.1 ThiF family adenylyltransferase [Ruegeria conchae]